MRSFRALIVVGVLGAATAAAGVYTMHAATSAAGGDSDFGQEPQGQARLVSDFSGFAGSESNARSLVAGLRQGKEISLVPGAAAGRSGTATRFTPPARSMDYSSIRVALGLAREQLIQLGITRPTPAQIKAVLAGGGIASRVDGRPSTPVLLPGILQMRAGGTSWARIAGTMGISLAQSTGGARQSEADEPMDSGRPEGARGERSVVPAAAAGPSAPVPRRATAEKAAPISSVSITTSSAANPAVRPEIRRPEPVRRAAKDDPATQPRHSLARVVTAPDATAGKATATVRATERSQDKAIRVGAASAPAGAGPDLSASDQSVD